MTTTTKDPSPRRAHEEALEAPSSSSLPSTSHMVSLDEMLYCQEANRSSPDPDAAAPNDLPTNANLEMVDPEDFHDKAEKEELQIGDHVYQWRSWMGIPGVFQHHGIVMDIQRNLTLTETAEDGSTTTSTITKLTIADFSNVEKKDQSQDFFPGSPSSLSSSRRAPEDPSTLQSPSYHSNEQDSESRPSTPKQNSVEIVTAEHKEEADLPGPPNESPTSHRRRIGGLVQEGILRIYTDTDKWRKVEYDAPLWKRTVYRAGTCTGVSADAVGLVLARVNFILGHPDVLPNYHVLNANCECVAVWCRTGHWATLQASSFLEMTAAGQVKSSATLAATAATAQVSVVAPSSGVWGWLGFTTTSQVSWLSLHPAVIPALAGYAVVSVGAPAALYVQARKEWKATTERLKEAFWEDAMENPEVFAECMTHWSDKN